MRRGTTPTFSFTVDMDLTDWDVYITFEQNKHELTRKNPDITPVNDGSRVDITLTQQETLAFKVGKARAQIRAIKDEVAVATSYFEFAVNDILLDGEIPQEV